MSTASSARMLGVIAWPPRLRAFSQRPSFPKDAALVEAASNATIGWPTTKRYISLFLQ